MSDKSIIKPIKLLNYSCKQSKSKVLPRLPLRGILLAPSGSGKSVMLASMLLEANMYRNCFERIYIFSPSIHVDQTWQAVKDYQEKVMNVEETETEKVYFDHYDPEDLQNIIDTQHRVILEMKKRKLTKSLSIAIIIDDFSDDTNFSRHSKLLQSFHKRTTQQHIYISKHSEIR